MNPGVPGVAARFEVEQHAASFGHHIHHDNHENGKYNDKDNDHKHSATSSQRGRARNPSDKDENRHYFYINLIIGKNLVAQGCTLYKGRFQIIKMEI